MKQHMQVPYPNLHQRRAQCLTVEEMKEALLSHGGISGVRVAIVQSFDNSLVVEQQKIPGITKLNNFTHTKDGLLAHRSFSIGRGKCIIL